VIDFSYSCAAADKMSTDLRARAVSLRQLSYLLVIVYLLLIHRSLGAATLGHCYCQVVLPQQIART